jgi:phosphoglycolate phosphatase-like HAD superfamily hydrolase
MKRCYVFDIDGTIADGSHRVHHLSGIPKNWETYFIECVGDSPIQHVIAVAVALKHAGHDIVLVSGRSDEVKAETVVWLAKYLPCYSALYMRKAGDHRDDDTLKTEMLAQLRADGWEPVMAFDDRTRVVKAWRAAGIPCAQVAEGDF